MWRIKDKNGYSPETGGDAMIGVITSCEAHVALILSALELSADHIEKMEKELKKKKGSE